MTLHGTLLSMLFAASTLLAPQARAEAESCAILYAQFRDAPSTQESQRMLPELARWKAKQQDQYDRTQCAVMRAEEAQSVLRSKLNSDWLLRTELAALSGAVDHCQALRDLFLAPNEANQVAFCGPSAGEFESVETEFQRCAALLIEAEARVRRVAGIKTDSEYRALLLPRAQCPLPMAQAREAPKDCADCRREIKVAMPKGLQDANAIAARVASKSDSSDGKKSPTTQKSPEPSSKSDDGNASRTDRMTAPQSGQGANVAGITRPTVMLSPQKPPTSTEVAKLDQAIRQQIELAVQKEMEASEKVLAELQAKDDREKQAAAAEIAKTTKQPEPKKIADPVAPEWRSREAVVKDAETAIDQWLGGKIPTHVGQQMLDLEFHASERLQKNHKYLYPKFQKRWARTMAELASRTRDREDVLKALVAEYAHTYNRDEGANFANAMNDEGGNCSLNSKIDVAAFTQLDVQLEPDEQLALQLYSDHIAAVIVKKTSTGVQVRDLYSGGVKNEVISPIVHPAYLLRSLVKTLDGKTRPVEDFVLYRPDPKKRDQYQKELLTQNLFAESTNPKLQKEIEAKVKKAESAVEGPGFVNWLKQAVGAIKSGAVFEAIADFFKTGKLPSLSGTNDVATFDLVGGEVSYGLGRDVPKFSEVTYQAPPPGLENRDGAAARVAPAQSKIPAGVRIERNADLDAKGLVAYLRREPGGVSRRTVQPKGAPYDPNLRDPKNYTVHYYPLSTWATKADPNAHYSVSYSNLNAPLVFKNAKDMERFMAIPNSVDRLRFVSSLAKREIIEDIQSVFSEADLEQSARDFRSSKAPLPSALSDRFVIANKLSVLENKIIQWNGTLNQFDELAEWTPLDGKIFNSPLQDPEIASERAKLFARLRAIKKYAAAIPPEEISKDLKTLDSDQVRAFLERIDRAQELPESHPLDPAALPSVENADLIARLSTAQLFLNATAPELLTLTQRDPQGKLAVEGRTQGDNVPLSSAPSQRSFGNSPKSVAAQSASKGTKSGNLRFKEQPLLRPATHDRKIALGLTRELFQRARDLENPMLPPNPNAKPPSAELRLQQQALSESLRKRAFELLTSSVLQDLTDNLTTAPPPKPGTTNDGQPGFYLLSQYLEPIEAHENETPNSEARFAGVFGGKISGALLELQVAFLKKATEAQAPAGQRTLLNLRLRDLQDMASSDAGANEQRFQERVKRANLYRTGKQVITPQFFDQTLGQFIERSSRALKSLDKDLK